jgi:hypothetical protein
MVVANYKTKKALKDAVGKKLNYTETSLFGTEYMSDGSFAVVGPSKDSRKWYAEVTIENDLIKSVK